MTKNNEKDILLDHEYDGIKELDNDLPPWWLNLFYITIAFAFVYLLYYHVSGIGYSSADSYKKEMNPEFVKETINVEKPSFTFTSPWKSDETEITPKKLSELSGNMGVDVSFEQLISEAKKNANDVELTMLNETFPGNEINVAVSPTTKNEFETGLVALMDESSLKAGESVYMKNCAVCHGDNGQGMIGPNFTDEYWIHGGSMDDIVKLIRVGVPAKGMIPWDKTLSQDEIKQVASYIITLEGTSPANQKAPEGEIYKRN